MEAFRRVRDASAAFCNVGHEHKAAKEDDEAEAAEIKRIQEEGDGIKTGVGDKESASCSVGVAEDHGNQPFFDVSPAAIPLYEVGLIENAPLDVKSYEVGDANCVSPRVSFSHDFVISENNFLSQSNTCRVSREGERGEQDMKDHYSVEFEFLRNDPGCGVPDEAKGLMSSADELFFNGKLLPLLFPSVSTVRENLSESLSCSQQRQGDAVSLQTTDDLPMGRHLNFELPKMSSSLSLAFRAKFACILMPSNLDAHEVDSSSSEPVSSAARMVSLSSSSPPSSMLPPSSILPMPLISTSGTKCSTKFKAFFKSTKRFSKYSQFTKESSSASTCSLSTSFRTFLPFSRSNSASQSNTMVPPPLPCRSNSAGESHLCNDSSMKELDVLDVTRLSTSTAAGTSMEQGFMDPECEGNPCRTQRKMLAQVASSDKVMKPTTYCANTCADSAKIGVDNRSIGSHNSSKASKVRSVGTLGKSGVKAGGKIVLRNLERCSAETKLGREGWRGLNRRGSFPVGARVSPVLNVAVYRGSSIGLFKFNSLPVSKKEKPSNLGTVNWRNGAC